MRPSDLFFNFKHGQMDGPTDISSYRDAILHFGDVSGHVPIHEEKPSLINFENTWLRTDGRTDGRTDRRTDRPSYRDARTHLKSCNP